MNCDEPFITGTLLRQPFSSSVGTTGRFAGLDRRCAKTPRKEWPAATVVGESPNKTIQPTSPSNPSSPSRLL
nr:hypothetical protein Iba_chr12dCG12000 [Ipomoea batatas]